jgi:hypothetical protein
MATVAWFCVLAAVHLHFVVTLSYCVQHMNATDLPCFCSELERFFDVDSAGTSLSPLQKRRSARQRRRRNCESDEKVLRGNICSLSSLGKQLLHVMAFNTSLKAKSLIERRLGE